MPHASPERKLKRLVALCPTTMHEEFLRVADRSGESAAVLLRSLVAEAIERARRDQPITLQLAREA